MPCFFLIVSKVQIAEPLERRGLLWPPEGSIDVFVNVSG
jgi:hypothetical protein